MEVKCGFKKSELGPIPEDWIETNIGALEPFVTSGSRGWARFYSETGDLFVRITNMSRESIYLDLTEPQFVRLPPSEHEGRRTQLRHGDFLISVTADIGIVSYVDARTPTPAYINQHIALVRLDSCAANPRFISYLLSHARSQRRFRAITDQGAKTGINLATVKGTCLTLPSPAEQEAIAEALSDADVLIESLEQLLAKKRHLKQGAMQELLTGKKRLPGFSGKWEINRFGEVALPRKERIDPRRSGIHEFCIELEHIEQGSGCLIGSSTTDDGSSLKSVFQRGDVLFGKLRAYLRKYWFADRAGVCSTEIWVLVAKRSQLTPEFLFQLVKTDLFVEVASTAYGTHMPRSDWNVVKNYEVYLPSTKEQTAIAGILSDMDAEIAALEAKLAKARRLKQGMMQELLTGRTRLV